MASCKCCHICRCGEHIPQTHGMPGGNALVFYLLVVLRVRFAIAANIEEKFGQVEPAPFTRRLIELDQPEFDLLMARGLLKFAGAKIAVDKRCVFEGNVQQVTLACCLVPGDCGFIQVPGIVQFVA